MARNTRTALKPRGRKPLLLLLSLVLFIAVVVPVLVWRGRPMAAEVVVDAGDPIGVIDPNIYGHFIEHLGRCIYGGVWAGENSSIPNLRGLRVDVLEAARAIRPPVIRWPGGNFASGYHWEDGVGPRGERPVLPNLAWGGNESNQFGTDEFIDFCREVGAEPYICVNVGSGTPEEAAHWVEYCNSNGTGEYARRRAGNGHPEPFHVRYWGIGNEMYGPWQIGYMNATEYADAALRFALAMREVDPTIRLVAVGWYGHDDWNRRVLEVAGEHIDYLSVHRYYGTQGRLEDHYTTVAYPLEAEGSLRHLAQLIDEVTANKPGRTVKIALDEWHVWRPTPQYFMDALFAAGVFHVFHRLCNNVTMANLALLVNTPPDGINAIVATDQGGLSVKPVYLAFKLYAENTGDIALRTATTVGAYRAGKVGLDQVPFLDCSATIARDGATLYLAAVNRHRHKAVRCRIELRDFTPQSQCTVRELYAPSPNLQVPPNSLEITNKTISVQEAPFFYTFPPHSATILKFAARPG